MGSGSPQPPKLLGRYALYEKIASGGMASVHIGRLLGPVGFARTVAIKRMHPQFAEDPEFVSMFLDEARLAARIRHPNVVPTLDVVTLEGELFLVMDYVQGESLSRLVRVAAKRGEQIPPAMVATLMVGVLHGLHAAHEAKNDHGEPLAIVHRDVSPHNVLVGTDGAPRVLDFGVAKAMGRLQTTREGQLKGKLAYMAPEQVRAGPVTRATDIYAASVVLWEALTGKRLFSGDNEAAVLSSVLAGCSEPPSKWIPALPPELSALTMRGLSLDPSARFATAREMARALENAVPLVAASVIGEWVEAMAKETLDERSARIAAIETDSSVQAPVVPAVVKSRSRTGAIAEPGFEASADDNLPTQLSSGSASARLSGWRQAGGRTVGAAAASAAGLLGVGVWIAASHHAGSSSVATAPDPPRAAAAVDVPPVAAQSATTAPTTPSAVPPSTATVPTPEGPTPSDSAAATVAKAPRRGAPAGGLKTAPAPSVRTPATGRCEPPYYFNADGARVFKPECL